MQFVVMNTKNNTSNFESTTYKVPYELPLPIFDDAIEYEPLVPGRQGFVKFPDHPEAFWHTSTDDFTDLDEVVPE